MVSLDITSIFLLLCTAVVAAFLISIIRPEQQKHQTQEENAGWGALHVAAATGLVPMAQSLVEQGADKDKASRDGCTPLVFAAGGGPAPHLAVRGAAYSTQAAGSASTTVPQSGSRRMSGGGPGAGARSGSTSEREALMAARRSQTHSFNPDEMGGLGSVPPDDREQVIAGMAQQVEDAMRANSAR